jgi:hypothetical protein
MHAFMHSNTHIHSLRRFYKREEIIPPQTNVPILEFFAPNLGSQYRYLYKRVQKARVTDSESHDAPTPVLACTSMPSTSTCMPSTSTSMPSTTHPADDDKLHEGQERIRTFFGMKQQLIFVKQVDRRSVELRISEQ